MKKTLTITMLCFSLIFANEGTLEEIVPDSSITSEKIVDGTILDVDINSSANINGSKLLDESITSTKITNGTIVDEDISSTALISDTKLNTISTSGKVANSATTAVEAATPNTIVLRNNNGEIEGDKVINIDAVNITTGTISPDRLPGFVSKICNFSGSVGSGSLSPTGCTWGNNSTIYVKIDVSPNKTYRYNGSYVLINDSILNADTLDSYNTSTGTTPNTIPVRDSSGKIPGSITGNASTADSATKASIVVTFSSGAPSCSSGDVGKLYYNTVNNKLYVCK